jgi:hypothetical protein
MATMPMSEDYKRAMYAAVEQHGNIPDAAAALRMSPKTLADGYRRALRDLNLPDVRRPNHLIVAAQRMPPQASGFTPPALPSPSVPVEELLGHLAANFERKREAAAARHWMRFHVHDPAPFGLAFVGDPHVGDDGCDVPTLMRHVEVLEQTQGLFGVGMGDWTNNWTGRLARLYAEQSTTKAQELQLAEWLLRKTFWMLLLRGNHDMWSGAGDPLKWICNGAAPLVDWAAQFEVECGGQVWRISAAHDFPGSSMWNKLHALLREAKLTGHDADVYVAAHRHIYGMAEEQDEKTGAVAWLMRAKGYKAHDTYALVNGYGQRQDRGQTVTAIFNPTSRAVRGFSDLEEAAEFLTWLRRRRVRVQAGRSA